LAVRTTRIILGIRRDLGHLDDTDAPGREACTAIGGETTTHAHFTDAILRGGLNYQFHSYGDRRMSANGTKRILRRAQSMSALPLKADMDQSGCDVRFVPKADSCTAAKSR